MNNIEEKNNFIPILIKQDDLKQVAQIIFSFWGKEGSFSDSYLLRIIKQGLSYKYEIDGNIIGICLLHKHNSPKYPKTAEITILCIKEEYQKKGMGERLLKKCIESGFSSDINKIKLHVSIKNIPALSLYKKLGFIITKTIEKYYNDKTDDPEVNTAYEMNLLENKQK